MNKKKTLIFLPVLFLLFLCLLYEIVFRSLITQAYLGLAPEWFSIIIKFLYPRFEIEKERFSINFFLSRADQVLYRFTAIFIILSIVFYLIKTSEVFKIKFIAFWNIKTSKGNIAILRLLLYLSLICIFYDAYTDLVLLHNAKAFYKPVLLLRLLHISYPSNTQSLYIFIGYVGSCLLVIFNILPVFFSILSVAFLILLEGLFFGFEKIDHGFAPLTYAALIFPLLLYQKGKLKIEEVNGWPLKLITVCIALVYLMSASEKLLLSGIRGISTESFRLFLHLHATPFGLIAAQSNLLCTLLPTMALLFQLSFAIILFFPRLKFYILSIGITFHLLVYLLFNIGGIVHPWILSYIFFIDWGFIANAAKKIKYQFFWISK